MDLDDAGPVGALMIGLSAGSDSPKMTDIMESSRPIKSRITLRVIRCQKDSSSSAAWVVGGFVLLGDEFVVCSSMDSLMICSRPIVLGTRSRR